MNAIELLRRTGLTTSDIAKEVGCTPHAIRHYETGRRFPNGKQYRRINDLALRRGLSLTAADFETKPEAA